MTLALRSGRRALRAWWSRGVSSRRARVSHALLLAWALVSAGVAMDVRSEEAPPAASERSIKAAFIFKFLSYVEWPALAFSAPEAPIVIGVIGADDVAAELAQVTASRTANNRPVLVRRLHEGESLAGVHVLYIGRSEAARLPVLVRSTQQRAILTIADIPGGLEHGVAINFLIIDGRVRFEIAPEAAERGGLKLSSRLLSVAQNVRAGS